jgi:ribosome modulation factor
VRIKPKRRNARHEPGDPYADGADAAVAGAPLEANPYDLDDLRERTLWESGWRSVRDDKAIA